MSLSHLWMEMFYERSVIKVAWTLCLLKRSHVDSFHAGPKRAMLTVMGTKMWWLRTRFLTMYSFFGMMVLETS